MSNEDNANRSDRVRDAIIDYCQVKADESFRLTDHDPSWAGTEEMRMLGEETLKEKSKKFLEKNTKALSDAQELLYASNQYSLLLVFQAMDAAGKDGTIKHVISGVNPQGCQVFSFKRPSAEELDHHFLWRYTKRLPERGRIGIFNRSYYEEVLVVRVHPELLESQQLPNTTIGSHLWKARYEDINNLEKHLVRNGTMILKFFLNVSKDEQRRRFIERLTNPEKHWKYSESDLEERQYWDQYMQAFEDAIRATSSPWAPWYVIPADHKWAMRAIVSQIITQKIQSLDMRYPEVSDEKRAKLTEALAQLKREDG